MAMCGKCHVRLYCYPRRKRATHEYDLATADGERMAANAIEVALRLVKFDQHGGFDRVKAEGISDQ